MIINFLKIYLFSNIIIDAVIHWLYFMTTLIIMMLWLAGMNQ